DGSDHPTYLTPSLKVALQARIQWSSSNPRSPSSEPMEGMVDSPTPMMPMSLDSIRVMVQVLPGERFSARSRYTAVNQPALSPPTTAISLMRLSTIASLPVGMLNQVPAHLVLEGEQDLGGCGGERNEGPSRSTTSRCRRDWTSWVTKAAN